jgi:hypothetical protein
MAERSFWKGQLRLSLVTIPVRMISATNADAEIHFHQIDRNTKKRIRYVKTAPGVGEVANENIVKAFDLSICARSSPCMSTAPTISCPMVTWPRKATASSVTRFVMRRRRALAS